MIGFTAARVSFFETTIQTDDKKCRIAGNKGCKGWSEKGGGWGSNANSAFVFPPPPLFVAQVTPALQIGPGQPSRWKSQGQDIEKNQISWIIFKSEEAYSPPNFHILRWTLLREIGAGKSIKQEGRHFSTWFVTLSGLGPTSYHLCTFCTFELIRQHHRPVSVGVKRDRDDFKSSVFLLLNFPSLVDCFSLLQTAPEVGRKRESKLTLSELQKKFIFHSQ